MASGILTVAGSACRPQRSWLLSLHDNQHDTPSFLKSLLNFFVAKREKSGVALTMSLGKWETIVVKCHYRPCVIRLNGIDPRWSEPAKNDVRFHCRPRPMYVTINLGNRVSKVGNSKNLRAFLETSQLLYAAPNAIFVIDSIAVTHMEWRVGWMECSFDLKCHYYELGNSWHRTS
jgi:hypothetical protein